MFFISQSKYSNPMTFPPKGMEETNLAFSPNFSKSCWVKCWMICEMNFLRLYNSIQHEPSNIHRILVPFNHKFTT